MRHPAHRTLATHTRHYSFTTQITHLRRFVISGFTSSLMMLAGSGLVLAQDIVITGVIDGPLTGGIPKAVELCVLNPVADLSIYGLGSANNGGGTNGEEFTFPAVAVAAGTFIYVASEASAFTDFFGFAPTYTSGAANINGNDAIELFTSSVVTDIYGVIDVDGTGEAWEYLDGWAYRDDGTGPDGDTFVVGNWTYSGPNALDGESTNGTASVPFPIGAYASCELPEPVPELLLTEIVVTPTAGEFLEIHNAGAAPVDLSNMYLTDATFAGGSTYYYNIVTGTNAGGGGFADFHARFPDGASIGPGEFQTIAITGSDNFFAEYGINPDYELFEDGGAPDAIPDMREALAGSINNQGGLTNGGEVAILYTWDGSSDLVQDIDYAIWGDTAEAVDKTGVNIDGPDGGGETTAYLADTAIASQDIISGATHAVGDAYQRIDFGEGTEIQAGGNGVAGSDETSENLSETWASAAATPGAGPAAPPAQWVVNEIHADPANDLPGDANGDGERDFSDDEFVELVNISGSAVDVSGWTLSDGNGLRHTFPADTIVPDQCAIVIFGGGAPAGPFGNALVQTASTGSLQFSNSGDEVYLNNGVSDVATAAYGSEGGDNQSLTLDPDLTGTPPLVKHTTATGADGALYSPGTQVDGSRFVGCPTGWVINELQADPAGDISGDANGDGERDSTDDEFVEIVNNTGAHADISGWTLADGFSVRHTFPADSIVYNGCSVVVFGGGTPTGDFGASLVQTASSNSLGLNNGGDTVTLNDGSSDVASVTYGGEGGDNQSLTLDPDVTGALPMVKHSAATGSGGSLFSPGTRIDATPFDGCPVTAEIYAIQGDGAASPLEGKLVMTDADVVTALAPDGFFMQTPTATTDGNPDTSDGIFVFLDSAPTVSVGDLVDVKGTIAEFFEFTEITDVLSVEDVGDGDLPAAIALNGSVPSPNLAAPSCAIEFECYEGMLVEVVNGITTSGNQFFGSDPIAETYATASGNRAFREPGTEYPIDLGGSIPQWDGNPELFELDPDKLGLPNETIFGGSSFSATGVIGFEFGGYELWPTELSFTQAAVPASVRSRVPGEYTIGSLNLWRFATDRDYVTNLAKLSAYILEVLDAPDILAVQEAETLNALNDLAAAIAADDASVNYTAHLVEGNDAGGIDVGFLLRDSITPTSLTQLGAAEVFDYDASLLHDRPPLLLQAEYDLGGDQGAPVAVMVVHNRSLNGIETERVQLKRLTQAQSIAEKVQDFQTTNPSVPLAVVGDFNAFEFTDGYADVVGQIMGDFDPAHNLHSGPDLVNPNLTNQVLSLPPSSRYSFVFRGNAQVLDHALTSSAADKWLRGFEFGRGNADAARIQESDINTPMLASDHDGFVLYMMTDKDGDGVPDDLDGCPSNSLFAQPHPQHGCFAPIPTLSPSGLLWLLLLIGGLGGVSIRHRARLARH